MSYTLERLYGQCNGLYVVKHENGYAKISEKRKLPQWVEEIVRQKEQPQGVQIKRWDNGEVIYTSSKETIREVVEEAVANGVSLRKKLVATIIGVIE